MRLFAADVGPPVTRIAPEELDALMAHRWPGNERELQNVDHRAMLSSDDDPLAIKGALEQTKGHIASAAKLLGLGRATLYRRLVEAGLKVDGRDAPGPDDPAKA